MIGVYQMDNQAPVTSKEKLKKPLKLNYAINSSSLRILTVYFSVNSGLEMLAYGIGGFFSIVAAYIWLFTGVFFAGYFLFDLGLNIYQDIKGKKYFLVGAFLALIALFFFYMGSISYSDINPDAAQQVASGLEAFKATDLNYTGTAFLGYPSRQYLIASIPALLFGRSVFTLHAGFGVLFLIGLYVLFKGLRDYLENKGINEEYALLPCFAFLAFPFITEYYMNFEQAITPVALTMLALGIFLKLIVDCDIIKILAISYIGCLMADSYTPVLASLGLLLVFLGIYAYTLFSGKSSVLLGKAVPPETHSKDSVPLGNKTSNKKTTEGCTADTKSTGYALIGCSFNILAFFITTYVAGRSDRITEFRKEDSIIKAALKIFKEFFTDANVRFLGLFGGIVVIYILLSLAGRLLLADALVSLWVFGVAFFSDFMTGYTAYDKAWVMQRNMIVIPVLITFIFLAITRFIKKHGLSIRKPVQVILLIFFLFAGIFNFSQPHHSFKYFSYIRPMKYVIDYVEDSISEYGLKNTDEFTLVIYTDNVLQSNIHDYAKFFFPNATTYSESGTEYDYSINSSRITFIYAEDTRLDVMGIEGVTDSSQKTYRDARYDEDITWYRKIVK